MGGCATKHRDAKDEGEAPPPLPAEEKERAAEEVSDDTKAKEKEDENKRASLSNLFRESEKRREASENDEEVSVKETITTANVVTKGEEEEPTKAQVHPTHGAELAETAEPKEISAPTNEETSVPPSIPMSVAPVAEEKPIEVESVKEVVSVPSLKETCNSSLVATSETPVAEPKAMELESIKEVAEDSNTGDVEQKTTVVDEKGHAKLEASSTAEKQENGVLPSSTTETT